jgi:protein-tyrosine-phosphatase
MNVKRWELDMTDERAEQRQTAILDRVVDDLAYSYEGVFSRESVAQVVQESHDLLLEKATVKVYVVALTERFAHDRLAAQAKAQGLRVTDTPEVLFICVRNAGRSQMAAALMTLRSGGQVHVRSAGSEPGDEVHPLVQQAMAEIGAPLTEAFPKPLTDDVVRASDVVITMGCGDACPFYPGKRYLDWDLADPADLPIEGVRAVRDEIDRRVRELLGEILPGHPVH